MKANFIVLFIVSHFCQYESVPEGCDVPFANFLGDGFCDSDPTLNYNTAECNWDEGDCCEETCQDGTAQCGSNGYTCLDPSTASPTVVPTSNSTLPPTTSPTDFTSSNAPTLSPTISATNNQTAFPTVNLCTADLNRVGDGWCDYEAWNTAECNWDGGDCCEATCVDGAEQCGSNGFFMCLDPAVNTPVPTIPPSLMPSAVPTILCNVDQSRLGDGWCDYEGWNTAGCGWDGGDCCEQTCVDGAFTCGSNGFIDCKDPTLPTTTPSAQPSEVPTMRCNVDQSRLGDGWCDYEGWNTADCEWDGGDCCEATCVDGAFTCGSNGFIDCRDPAVTETPTSLPTSFPTFSSEPSSVPSASPSALPTILCNVDQSRLGDGWCDYEEWNTAECGWDGGDCCEATCVDGAFTCGSNGFIDCRTSAPTLVPTSQPTSAPSSLPSGLPTSNPTRVPSSRPTGNPTCQPTASPSAAPTRNPTSSPTSKPTSCPSCSPTSAPTQLCNVDQSRLGDGWCDYEGWNTADCEWDGGDCCESTCVDGAFTCGSNGFIDCRDPRGTQFPTSAPTSFPTFSSEPSSVPSTSPSALPTRLCNVDQSRLGDGWCDYEGWNTAECGWDGGDCCEQTCVDGAFTCGSNGFIDCRTSAPTLVPTSQPTSAPTFRPTSAPTFSPTSSPTCLPTSNPTPVPSTVPTAVPTCQPTAISSAAPTRNSTFSPTSEPTSCPSSSPTAAPTLAPTSKPTFRSIACTNHTIRAYLATPLD